MIMKRSCTYFRIIEKSLNDPLMFNTNIVEACNLSIHGVQPSMVRDSLLSEYISGLGIVHN
jgi:hypothetical protein